ncbi:YebC/PmpR family DNA-binding transcriptional regulator [Acetobacteraceae bacterium]|nr:YebC/PmpR family DNA-binding transcriptional regulator [Acetobacteraceae bacterium]
MAGHSKFKNIMHRKGAQDARRARDFAKVLREITVATKEGLPDPAMNPRLRSAIIAARDVNMPKDNIDRAIKKASGEGGGEDYTAVRYEGYGPGGIAVIVEGLTDNRNRTASDVRAAFSKHGGSLGEDNSVSFMFDRVGAIVYPLSIGSEEEILEAAIEAGAENAEQDEENHEILTSPDTLMAVREALEKTLGEPRSAKLDWRPKNTIVLDGDQARTALKLIDALEDNDDVQTVYANFDLSDEIKAEFSE